MPEEWSVDQLHAHYRATGEMVPDVPEQGKPKHKYGAVRTEVDGITFASKAEAKRYVSLTFMQKAGEISDLECQPRFPLRVNGVNCGAYVGDFRYTLPNGEVVIEDVKGMPTPVYRLKRKLMKAIHGIEIKEVAA